MDGASRGLYTSNGLSRPESDQEAIVPRAPQRKPFPPGVDAEQVNRAASQIENAEKSDVEGPGFDGELELYREKGNKRSMGSSRTEQDRRKVRVLLTRLGFDTIDTDYQPAPSERLFG